jgi:hypothetical protein
MTLSSEPVGSIKNTTFLHARPSFPSNTRGVGVMTGCTLLFLLKTFLFTVYCMLTV